MDELKEIVEVIEKAKVDVLKLEKGDFKLYYQKNSAQDLQIKDEDAQEILLEEGDNSGSQIIKDQKNSDNKEDFHYITSPIIGAFYSRPNPNSEPYVEVGSKIAPQDTVCVLEAMKLLNEIKSDVNGEIVEILVEDEEIIEYGQLLFKVKVNE